MTKTTENLVLTVLVSGTTLPYSEYENRVYLRGELVTLSPELVAGTEDRNGKTIADLAQDEERQLERWGVVRFKVGDHTGGIKFVGDDDSTVTFRKRELAEERAKKLPSKDEVRAGLRAVSAEYGPRETSQHSMKYPEPRG